MNGMKEKSSLGGAGRQGAAGSFTRPDLAIPRRVAFPQSPTLLHQATLKTILNRIERHKSFVYGKARILEEEGESAIEVDVEARANGRPRRSGWSVTVTSRY